MRKLNGGAYVTTFWDYVQAIVIIAAVIFAAYYVTKLVAKTGVGAYKKAAGIKQLSALGLGRDKSVTIVEIGAFVYILGVSAQHVELIDKLTKEEFALQTKKEEQSAPMPGFSASFREELNKRFGRNGNSDGSQ